MTATISEGIYLQDADSERLRLSSKDLIIHNVCAVFGPVTLGFPTVPNREMCNFEGATDFARRQQFP